MIPYRITIHCSASPNGKIYPIEQIRKDHIARGFKDIGYHLVIQADGQAIPTRSLTDTGAHVLHDNVGNIGVCLIGNDKFSQKQFDVLRYQLDSLVMLYNIPVWEIYTHNQFKSAIQQQKACPNIPINVILAWYIGGKEKAIANHVLHG